MKKVFIDGSAGTTGLHIVQRLGERQDLLLLTLPEELRKDPQARKDCINQADIVFLCLPDDAAREAAAMVENEKTAVIDTSTAHRVQDGWVYGFPELKGQRTLIQKGLRIANPGCHASGFIALAAPLTDAGLLPRDALLSCFSLTGYSGGGKKMIAQYESPDRDALLDAPRQYGLSQAHKHLPEMAKYAGLSNAPAFCPIVAPYYAGMEVTLPLFPEKLGVKLSDIQEAYRSYYQDGVVFFAPSADEGGLLSAGAFAGRDDMQITVTGNEERALAIARFDNLGKGACGAAIQNMNILIGAAETAGLVLQ